MASLKAVQKRVPSADVVAGRVIAYEGGKHYDIGEYVGDGAVILNKDGEKLMVPKKKEIVIEVERPDAPLVQED